MDKRIILFLFFALTTCGVYSQNTFTAVIVDGSDQQAMPGCIAMVKGTSLSTIADAEGLLSLSVPDGEQTIICSFSGYKKWKQKFVFPLDNMESITIFLKPKK